VHLKVLRENKIIEVSGQLTPAPDVIDRQGVQFSGVLFANSPVEYENAFGELTTIMVHDIETGSEGNGAGIEIYDFLVRVNGTPVHNLAQLRQLLMSVRDTSEKTQLDFLRISDVYGSGELFESVRRDLRWTAPIEIGPWPNIQSVSQTKDSRME
jgi:S1-C subfamily serine protease